MAQKLYIVSRGYTEMYEQLRRAMSGEPEVEIIYDRRSPEDRRDPEFQRRGRKASIWSRGPLPGEADRRTPSHVDIDLRIRGWAVIGGRADPGLEIRLPLAPPISQHQREGTGAALPEMSRTGNAETVAGHRMRIRTQTLAGARLSFWLALAVLLLLNIAVFIIIVVTLRW
jgi:hypothetical protein